jgi:hypothetical protein
VLPSQLIRQAGANNVKKGGSDDRARHNYFPTQVTSDIAYGYGQSSPGGFMRSVVRRF